MAGSATPIRQPLTTARVVQREPWTMEGTQQTDPHHLDRQIGGAMALGGVAAAAPLALLGTLVGQWLRKQKV